jgi:hypothetical protein
VGDRFADGHLFRAWLTPLCPSGTSLTFSAFGFAVKFNRIAAYLSQSDIAGSLIYCRMLMGLGRLRSAKPRLIELFERLDFSVPVTSDADARRRMRALGDAATWLADSFLAEKERDNGIAFFRRMLIRSPNSEVLHRSLCRLLFPGDDYLQILKELHRQLRPKFYLEIGVSQEASLSCVMASPTRLASTQIHA